MKIRRIDGLIMAILLAIGHLTCESARAAELPSKANVEAALNTAAPK